MKAIAADDPRRVFERVPFTQMLGMRRSHSEAGRARFTLQARPELGNVIGAVHGGAVATLLDVAMASAAVSAWDFTHTAVTLSLETSFVGPGRGDLVAEAELLRRDENVAWCKARVIDAQGSLVATAQGSFRYLPWVRDA